MIKIGEVNTLKVKRKTDIGYMLTDGTDDVFLHFNESNHENLVDNQSVKAFLYYDAKARLAATLSTPIITVSHADFVSVKEVNHELGVFVSNNTSKDMLVSKDYLPYDFNLWPEKGDTLYCMLKLKNRLVAKPLNKVEISLVPETKLDLHQHVDAYVIYVGKEGLNMMTREGHLVFVHHTQMRRVYRLGEMANVRIARIHEGGYSGSLIEVKEKMMDQDANMLYEYLVANGGKMPFTSDSDKDAIYETFKLSKKAFKRALGRLYSERKVIIQDDQTILVKGE
ncbi:S1-like domain-containing RNA-binding protein [Acholeplasma vituli]|uniref:S1-like domain-containing RNA-binding protein n=1 Tax=Paracholeplasma vituli TaxID=69473 RepID=A0ABT2PU88_9MOLU|nr:S1-like domain-containing RNA-binding protein [Paracholeplasma vituli]MCU0104518.1 S1-like domain-containing RNA-binding protein [Paracholeplasma vituli]